jgi:DNA-binding NarL/FixJ family response regulator
MAAKGVSVLLKIVTVEDSPLIVNRVKDILKEIDGIRFVGNATVIAEALELIKNEKPDAVILDIKLGPDEKKNGINLLNILRNIYPGMKIIMLTNFTDIHYRTLCREYGADHFLDKSNDFDQIPQILKMILEGRA